MDIEKELIKFSFTKGALEYKVLTSYNADRPLHEKVYLSRTLTKSQTKNFIKHLKSICKTYDDIWKEEE